MTLGVIGGLIRGAMCVSLQNGGHSVQPHNIPSLQIGYQQHCIFYLWHVRYDRHLGSLSWSSMLRTGPMHEVAAFLCIFSLLKVGLAGEYATAA